MDEGSGPQPERTMQHIWSDNPEELDETATLWRYFKIERLIDVLKKSALYFSAATQFDDKFEGAVRIEALGAPVLNRSSASLGWEAYFRNHSPFAKISCWHQRPSENSLMWGYYADKERGVALRTTVGRLTSAIASTRIGNGTYYSKPMYCGKVRYIDLSVEQVPGNATRPVGLHKRYFYKHIGFDTEHEFRLLLPLYDRPDRGIASGEQGILVDCDLHRLVDAIVIGPKLAKDKADELREIAASVSLSDCVVESSLRAVPRHM